MINFACESGKEKKRNANSSNSGYQFYPSKRLNNTHPFTGTTGNGNNQTNRKKAYQKAKQTFRQTVHRPNSHNSQEGSDSQYCTRLQEK